jgi:uncharacterized protein (TIGR03118 family)
MTHHPATRWTPRLLATIAAAAFPLATANAQYGQVNLVSNIPGFAATTDPLLRNPWGISFGNATPFWVSDANAGVATLYNGLGVKSALVVTIPGPGGGAPGVPTGQVFNNANSFSLGNGANASFIFASATGNIAAWNGAAGTTALNEVIGAQGSSFTGLAIAGSGATARLYAANFGMGTVDVYDGSFAPVSVAGAFVDPNLPAGYSPFNVQNVGGNIVVTYAVVDPATGEDLAGAGNGIVDVYDQNGALIRRVSSGGALNSPWGVALAPSAFGPFGGALLIGNLGDGTINAFDFFTGAMLGTLSDVNGNPIVNDGLWGIQFGNHSATSDPNSLYIAAGLNDETDGLFARITATPEPGSLALLATGLGAMLVGRKRRNRA